MKKVNYDINLTKKEIETIIACFCECWNDGTDNMKNNVASFIIKVKDIMGFEKINNKEDAKDMLETFSIALGFKRRLAKLFED